MRAAGAPADVIEQWRQDNAKAVEILVLPENLPVLAVFLRCLPTHVGAGMGGVVCSGISSVEILAALRVSCIPRRDWPRFADDLHLMGRAYSKALNAKR